MGPASALPLLSLPSCVWAAPVASFAGGPSSGDVLPIFVVFGLGDRYFRRLVAKLCVRCLDQSGPDSAPPLRHDSALFNTSPPWAVSTVITVAAI
jgi:hypothetical protein